MAVNLEKDNGAFLRINDRKWSCSWCFGADYQTVVAPFIVDDHGFDVGGCRRHVAEFFPHLADQMDNPGLARPLRHVMTTVGHWPGMGRKITRNTFETFAEMELAARQYGESGIYLESCGSSDEHYERTGHRRIVWTMDGGNGPQVGPRIVVHMHTR